MENTQTLQFCPKCGRENVEHGKFCPQCGQSLTQAAQPVGPKQSAQPQAPVTPTSQSRTTHDDSTTGQRTAPTATAHHNGNRNLILNRENLEHVGLWIRNNLVTTGIGVFLLFLLFTFAAAHVAWWTILLLLVLIYLIAGSYGTDATGFERKVNRYYRDQDYRSNVNQNLKAKQSDLQAKTASAIKQAMPQQAPSAGATEQPTAGPTVQSATTAPVAKGHLGMGVTEVMVVLGALAALGAVYVGPYLQASASFINYSAGLTLANLLKLGSSASEFFGQDSSATGWLVALTVAPIVALILGVLPSRTTRIINVIVAIVVDVIFGTVFGYIYNGISGGYSGTFGDAGFGLSAWVSLGGCAVLTIFALISAFKPRKP
ncbi:zinc-ribbon domain-containing protein [Levilactobacillus wangkuiensis]|uniref:zinc-ribbon domain-containing protein n=1 Tax=Levilactobacillus wangkuiensis TaxID=2799566 RepID=UPI001942CED5|nr:zinc ribbon domain-containing protein [Levilactobacillus wangkuiensis]